MGYIREVIKKDGSKSYHAEVRIRGTAPQRASFRNQSLAKKWIQKTEAAIHDGKYFPDVESKKHTVGEMIDRFIEEWLPKFPKRLSKQKALLGWWKNQMEHILLSDLRPSIIARCRDKLLSEKTCRKRLRTPSTTNRYLASLGKVLSVCVQEWQWLDESPIKKVSKLKEGCGRDRFLSKSEKERLLVSCKESTNPYLYIMVNLSILTAMRYGELSHLRWIDIDFENKKITLEETKNGERRILPLTEYSEMLFKGCPTFGSPKNEFVFKALYQRSGSSVANVRTAFKKALEKAGIENFRWHDLRHTACSWMAMNGATQGELMAILGHRSHVQTRRYQHYSQKHLSDLMQRMGKEIFKGDENG